MEFNSKIISFQNEPALIVNSSELANSIKIELEHLDTLIEVFFDTRKDEEVVIDKVEYITSYEGIYLGVLDLYFQLLLNRAVEALDRVSPKELDFFCRTDGATPAFEYYNHEIYNILTIGEKILKKVMPKEEKEICLLDDNECFFDLPYAQQFELIEELCSHTFYKDAKYTELELDLVEVSGKTILLKSNMQLNVGDLKTYFKKYLIPQKTFILNLQ